MQPVLDAANGNPVLMWCEGNGVCTTDIKNFIMKIVVNCTVAECLIQGYNLEEGAHSFHVPTNHRAVRCVVAPSRESSSNC